jgi:hypothetical protein
MKEPIDELVAEMVALLGADLREDFEERAAIIEFEAKQSCAHAECLALLFLLRRHPSVLTGVTVLQVEMDGVTQWLLITNLDRARKYLSDAGGIEIGVRDLAEVIKEQFESLAKLARISNPGQLPAPQLFEHL